MRIEIESKETIADHAESTSLSKRLERTLHDALLFSPEVLIVDPNSLPRIEVGKTIRVNDERR